MKEIFDTKHARFWIQNGILYCQYRAIPFLDLATAQGIVRDRLHVQQAISYPVLCDIRGVKNSEKLARDYLAKNGSALARAVAIYDNRNIADVMLRFYLTKNKPTIPYQLFKDYEAAITFLHQYL